MSSSSSNSCCILLACLLVAAGGSTWAGDTVHKCRSAEGRTVFQATPCAATQRTEWVRDYPADPPAPVAPARPAATAQEATVVDTGRGRRGARRRAASQGAVISMHRDPVACERAKKKRDAAYARAGLKRDFAMSRALDDAVNSACR